MESDFVTQQHLESLKATDPSMAEVLNRYKFAPSNPPSHGHNFSGYPNMNSGLGHTDAVLLSNMLGQIQAGLQRNNSAAPSTSGFDGFQLNINSDVLKWIVLLLLVLLLVWLFLRVNKRRKNPLRKRLDRIENQLGQLKGKSLKKLKTSDEDEDFSEDFSEEE